MSPRIVIATVLVMLSLPYASTGMVQAADPECTRFASPSGSDSADGSGAQPFRTVEALADSLAPGDVGCVRGGEYVGDVTISRGGTSEADRVTIRGYSGEKATVSGRLWVKRGANFVTVEGLHLDGRNERSLPSPTINASDVTFRRNDVTNEHTEICFLLGSSTFGRAVRTVIEANKIHNCGRLPAANHDHGIYVEAADHTRIVDNWIYDNADRGIQLYPDAQHSVITGNVIDGNGSGIIFSGAGDSTSSDNTVESNVIANAGVRHNVESWYPSGTPSGERNVVRRNCLFGGARDARSGGVADASGFAAADNVVASPDYADAAANDLRIGARSACRAVYGDRAVPGPTTSAAPPAAPAEPLRPRPDRLAISSPRKWISFGGVLRVVVRANMELIRPGTRVKLKAKSRGRWRTIAIRRVGKRGRVSVKRRVRPRGRAMRVQAVIPRAARSKPVRLRVTR